MEIRVEHILKLLHHLNLIKKNVIPILIFHQSIDMLHQSIRVTEFLVSTVFKIYLYDMVLRNTSFKQMLTKDVEEKEGFTTPANAGDNLYHPIAFCRDEFFQVCFTFKIHNSMTFFCVKTRFSVANIRFLLDFTKFYRNLHGIFKVFKQRKSGKTTVNC